MACFLISLPFSPSINSLTSLSTSSLFTLRSISMPMPHSTQANLQFVCCSAMNGQQSTGTPAHMLSSIEFHPLWVKNPPIDGWLSTCSCGYQLNIIPLFFVLVTNSLCDKINEAFFTMSGLITHKKAFLLLASPQANSTICGGVRSVTLPKLTYIIELGSLELSHSRQSPSYF
ncbi:hypothetical protein I3843_10G136800 [Carya illinoinensis]|nr:hypothetical protein I3760_10G144000 [Carya illinoinensis]KAG7960694.1 hypothetical protein I3843_10G136800 [Carya illinoinensis]